MVRRIVNSKFSLLMLPGVSFFTFNVLVHIIMYLSDNKSGRPSAPFESLNVRAQCGVLPFYVHSPICVLICVCTLRMYCSVIFATDCQRSLYVKAYKA
jgi:hypothetical protein